MGLFIGFLVDGLGLGAFRLKIECFGPKLKVSDLSNLLWRSSGSLAFGTRIFSSSVFRRETQTERCLQFAPLIFRKNRIHAFKFFQKINMQRNIHTTHQKNTYLILTFCWGYKFTNQLSLGNNLNSRSTGEILGTLSSPVFPTDSTGE